MCRTLSYAGCTFETIEDAVSADMLKIYDDSARLWQQLYVVRAIAPLALTLIAPSSLP